MANYENAFTMDDLKKQVSNYQQFAVKESKAAPEDVFTSAVFGRDVIQKLLDTEGTHGVRIYLAKSSTDDTHDDMAYLMVPVEKKEDGSFNDLINDGHEHVKSGLIAMTDCIGKVCGEAGTSLIQA